MINYFYSMSLNCMLLLNKLYIQGFVILSSLTAYSFEEYSIRSQHPLLTVLQGFSCCVKTLQVYSIVTKLVGGGGGGGVISQVAELGKRLRGVGLVTII